MPIAGGHVAFVYMAHLCQQKDMVRRGRPRKAPAGVRAAVQAAAASSGMGRERSPNTAPPPSGQAGPRRATDRERSRAVLGTFRHVV